MQGPSLIARRPSCGRGAAVKGAFGGALRARTLDSRAAPAKDAAVAIKDGCDRGPQRSNLPGGPEHRDVCMPYPHAGEGRVLRMRAEGPPRPTVTLAGR